MIFCRIIGPYLKIWKQLTALTGTSSHDKPANKQGPRPGGLEVWIKEYRSWSPVRMGAIYYLGWSIPFHSRGTMEISEYMALPNNKATEQAMAVGRNLNVQHE